MLNLWDSEQIFFDGDQFFNDLLKDIDEAQEYITIEMYIFNDDLLGQKITEHLLQARKRGVKIQIIIDGIGSYHFFERLNQILTQEGIGVKVYNPLPIIHPLYGSLTFLRKLQALRFRLGKLNRRNHRKIITIDHHILYTGSFNITSESTTFHRERPWKELGARVTGVHVKFGVLNFKRVWKFRDYLRYKKHLKKSSHLLWKLSPLRLNNSLPMKIFYKKDFFTKMGNARERIWFMTPYFIPKRKLIRLLGKAAKRGCDVRLLLSEKTDVLLFRWLQVFYFNYLLKKGVRIFQYTDSILHAKNYIIDEHITLGSTNLNHRSFLHDLEVDLLVQDEENKQRITDNFKEWSSLSREITLEELKKRPLLKKFLSQVVFLFKYWC